MYFILAWLNMAFSLLTVNLERSDKNGLRGAVWSRYSFIVVAKSATGRRNPCNLTAIPDALCVFFLYRSFDTPKVFGVVLTGLYGRHSGLCASYPSRYGSPGGAAFGLAGIR